MPDRRNIYLSEEDQRDLAIIAYILAHDGKDGTIHADQSANRTVTLRNLIRGFKDGCTSRSDIRWVDFEAKLMESGLIDPHAE